MIYGQRKTVQEDTLPYHVIALFLLNLTVGFRLTCSEWVEEKKELANSGADIERIEGLLQSVQLRQSRDQLQDVVLQILHRGKEIVTSPGILKFSRTAYHYSASSCY